MRFRIEELHDHIAQVLTPLRMERSRIERILAPADPRVGGAGQFRHPAGSPQPCVYRAVQEALTICVRHAHAHRIDASLTSRSGALQMTFTDDGVREVPLARAAG